MSTTKGWFSRWGTARQKAEIAQAEYLDSFENNSSLYSRLMLEPGDRREQSGALATAVYLVGVTCCWAIVYLQPSLATGFLAGVVVPVLGLFCTLRYMRGSSKSAQRRATRRFYDRPTTYETLDLPSFAQNKVNGRETIHGFFREHRAALLRFGWWMPITILLWVVAVFIGVHYHKLGGAGVLALAGVTLPALRYWRWKRSILIITSERLISVTGIIMTKIDIMPKDKLTNMDLNVPFVSATMAGLRILDVAYGTIRFDSAGEEKSLKNVPYLPGVNEIYLLVGLVSFGGISPEADTIGRAIVLARHAA
ncbi:MAG TPA: PH domain-containing protein [Candidatus Saccharimonadia bacterium]|nr:PH domain-containing protein [Candidatus Saccharimonadia bacterium]